MRRRLAWLSLAVSSLVVFAFLVPLGLLVRNQAENRALTRGERDAQSIAAALAVAGASESGSDVSAELAGAVIEAFGGRPGISILFPDDQVVGNPIPPSDNIPQAQAGAAFTARIPGGAEVLVPVLVADSPTTEGTVVVRALVSDEELMSGVGTAWAMLIGLGVFLVLVAVAAADRLGRSIVRSVTELSSAARRMGEGDLGVRVDPDGPEEIADVGVAFNFLAGRLAGLLEAERESVADLSHRLRTPLTALRLQAETITSREDATGLIADVDRVEAAVDQMIQEARAPAASTSNQSAATDLVAIVRHRAGFWQVLADEQGRPTSVILDPGPLWVAVGEGELGALVDVLIENVFAHAGPGVGYIVRVRREHGQRASLVVEDSGGGFAEGDSLARGESTTGSTGLGIDIASRTAQDAGGSLEAGNSASGGATVAVEFPTREAPDQTAAGTDGASADATSENASVSRP